ncbi:glutamate-cysteine ligase family protein [Geofilum rubicundum]|nr:glutamate-cysteine ligase family protein [Geofilum rubicundum]
MNSKEKRYALFEVTGVELEYMIVDADTLDVKPLCDAIMKEVAGEMASEYENGGIAWSNELVNHVLELKTNGPAISLKGLSSSFFENVQAINRLLSKHKAVLMPTGAHPWMDPFTETVLWPHENNEIYALYNRIFDCRGHGWSNLQSTHINLPFGNDAEFGRLHAAIRLLLPLLPAIAASTPLLDGRPTGFSDSRLETYRFNQRKIPSIAGQIIPEAVFSEAEYHRVIFNPIIKDIRPYDEAGVLSHHFLNSRGAIARFDRGAVEIRLLDIQESSKADLAIVELIVAVLQNMVGGRFISYCQQQEWPEELLFDILQANIVGGEKALIANRSYLQMWGLDKPSATGSELWKHIFGQVKEVLSEESRAVIEHILEEGTLSTRILNALEGDFSRANLRQVYGRLSGVLNNNELF